jgi:hypothetical protein
VKTSKETRAARKAALLPAVGKWYRYIALGWSIVTVTASLVVASEMNGRGVPYVASVVAGYVLGFFLAWIPLAIFRFTQEWYWRYTNGFPFCVGEQVTIRAGIHKGKMAIVVGSDQGKVYVEVRIIDTDEKVWMYMGSVCKGPLIAKTSSD